MTHQLLLTEAEAAACLRLSARTLRKARADGQLHYILIGRSVRYTLEDLESYIASQRQVAPPCPPVPLPTARTTKAPRRRKAGAQIIPFHQRTGKRSGERL